MIICDTFRSRVLVAALAGILATGGLLCGCGSGDSSSTTSTTAPATSPTTPPPTTPTAGTTPPATTPKTTASTDGAGLFTANCAGCHGDKGAGGKRAPILAGKHTPEDEVVKIVTNGKGRMPAFKTRLKDDEIKSIAKYVATL